MYISFLIYQTEYIKGMACWLFWGFFVVAYIQLRFKYTFLGVYLHYQNIFWGQWFDNQLLEIRDVNDRECVIAKYLPIETLKTCSLFEPGLVCEPSTSQPCFQWPVFNKNIDLFTSCDSVVYWPLHSVVYWPNQLCYQHR